MCIALLDDEIDLSASWASGNHLMIVAGIACYLNKLCALVSVQVIDMSNLYAETKLMQHLVDQANEVMLEIHTL